MSITPYVSTGASSKLKKIDKNLKEKCKIYYIIKEMREKMQMLRPLGIEPRFLAPQARVLTTIRWPPTMWIGRAYKSDQFGKTARTKGADSRRYGTGMVVSRYIVVTGSIRKLMALYL